MKSRKKVATAPAIPLPKKFTPKPPNENQNTRRAANRYPDVTTS